MARRFLLLAASVASLGWPAPALAEVSDKAPSITSLWIWIVVLTVAAFFAGTWRWWAAVPVVAFALLVAWAGAEELMSFDVGPAILRELGEDHIAAAWVAAWVQAIAPAIAGLAGWSLHLLRRPRR